MNLSEERRHLDCGPRNGERPGGLGLVRWSIRCTANAETILGRARSVLRVVLSTPDTDDVTLEEWSLRLPEWFVVKCSATMSIEEAERWLAMFRKLSPIDQAKQQAVTKWSLSGWIHWFRPGNRDWFWWDAIVISDFEIRVALQLESWPCPVGAFKWLFRASGAQEVINI